MGLRRVFWSVVLLSLVACVHADWHPETAQQFAPLMNHAKRVYARDLGPLAAANAQQIGSIEATGSGIGIDYGDLAYEAADRGAEHGGTHYYVAAEDVRWVVTQNAGHADTTCQVRGRNVDCQTVFTMPSETRRAKPHAWIIVLRVERDDWGKLPAYLQPAPTPATPPPVATTVASEPASVQAPTRPAQPSRAPTDASTDPACDPPYSVDSSGNKHYKPECPLE